MVGLPFQALLRESLRPKSAPLMRNVASIGASSVAFRSIVKRSCGVTSCQAACSAVRTDTVVISPVGPTARYLPALPMA